MKKFVKLTSAVLVILILFFFYQIRWSYFGKKTWENAKNSKMVKIGMKKNQVIEIMGIPDEKKGHGLNNLDSSYHYRPPFASSGPIIINLDSSSKVSSIQYNDD
ncbi:hypothetical protein [Cecembia rubra]|uniref:hypothetical protein n=1 Tax=Cecembia rubra TaxID=1485585 RepID=UPI0027146336|nr:hypothetical protein [Cecembia rubra]